MALKNLSLRVLISVAAIPVILLISYLGGYYFLAFAGVIGLLALVEFYKLSRNKNIFPNYTMGIIALLFIIINSYGYFIDLRFFLLLWVPLLLIIELFHNRGSAIINLGASLLGVFYIGLMTGALVSIREFYPNVGSLYSHGGYLIISIFASIWICDSAAYFGGTAIGKHKLFLRVSPNKSWEGAIFGFLFAIIAMAAARLIILDFLDWKSVIIIGIIIGTIGQIGDLAESLIKRDADVKDSSSIIPGHGGVFDRFDSLLFTAPVIYLYLKFLS